MPAAAAMPAGTLCCAPAVTTEVTEAEVPVTPVLPTLVPVVATLVTEVAGAVVGTTTAGVVTPTATEVVVPTAGVAVVLVQMGTWTAVSNGCQVKRGKLNPEQNKTGTYRGGVGRGARRRHSVARAHHVGGTRGKGRVRDHGAGRRQEDRAVLALVEQKQPSKFSRSLTKSDRRWPGRPC